MAYDRAMIDLVSVMLTRGLHFGEGPRWHDGRLWYSDFYAHAISSVGSGGDTRVEVQLNNGAQPSGLGWLPDGRLIFVSMLDRRLVRREADGTLVTHADLSSIATWHCNDMVVDASGRAYVGNFGFDIESAFAADAAGEPERVERTNATLAIVHPDGTVETGPRDLGFPNGSVITPDGTTLIVAETMASRLSAFTIGEDGRLSDRRVWAEVPGVVPDGICLDAEGAIWVANALAPEAVRVAEGGTITHKVHTGNNCFACMLDDHGTLYLLTAAGADHATAAAAKTGAIRTVLAPAPRAGRP